MSQELNQMVEQSRQLYNRLQLLQQQFEESTDSYRNQSFRTEVLMSFSRAFDLAYDLNRLWCKLADVEVTRPVPLKDDNQLHGGTCIVCERVAPVLNDQDECEACHIQALMDRGLV